MFDFQKDSAIQPKIHVAHGLLPGHVNADQLPSSKQPFGAVLGQHWSHTVDVILPKTLYNSVWGQIEQALGQYEHSKVVMSLSQLLEGDFFNVYIKTGNISMLSQGRAGLDCLYSLRDGVLRLELPKEKYERAGLAGKAIQDGGRKHIKTSYAVEMNLREPSMVKGKKGFDRLLWACKNVLNESLTWLFIDHNAKQTLESGLIPISLYHPITKTVMPKVTTHENVLLPPLDASTRGGEIDEEVSLELLEWLGLLAIQSERILAQDKPDPYLSRYQVPLWEEALTQDLTSLRWHGFMDAGWIRRLLVECLMSSRKESGAWFAISAHAFRTQAVNAVDGYTILRMPAATEAEDSNKQNTSVQPEYLLWQMASTLNHR